MSKVIVDAFGGDNAPLCCIQGAVMARQKWGMEIALAGEEERIAPVRPKTAWIFPEFRFTRLRA